MNRLEARYAQHLEEKKHAGFILWYAFEGIKLRLADKTFLTPDFFVMTKDLELECHETKGFMQEDANVKLKCAAEKFPFKFLLIKHSKNGWDIKEV